MPEFRMELKRALTNRWFLFSAAIMLLVAIVAAIINVCDYLHFEEIYLKYHFENKYTYISSYSSYASWIAIDHIPATVELFFVLAPLTVTLGYAWSFASDRQSGYMEQLVTRTSRFRYYRAKYAATFISGGLLIAVPLIVNFIICACYIPSYAPDPFDAMYIPISKTELFGELFYAQPMIYVLVRTLVDFCLCGLWSVSVLALSTLIHNRIALIALPYLFLLLVKHVGQNFYIAMRTNGFERFGCSITLFDQLRGAPDAFFCPGWVTLLCALGMLIASVAIPCFVRKRDVL